MRIVLLFLLAWTCSVHGLKILCVFPPVAYSHYSIGRSLVRELAQRDHDVTFISPFEEKEPIKNLRTIVLTGFVETWAEMMKNMNMFEFGSWPTFTSIPFIGNMGIFMVEQTLSHENVQQLLHSNETFDVVLIEQFVSDGLQAIANHFGVPSVLVSTIGQSPWTNPLVGNPDIPSYMTNTYLEHPVHNSFLKRTLNLLVYCMQRLYDYFYFFPKQNAIVQKYLPNSPHIHDMIYNTSLILLNSDISFNPALPHVPNMIQIGGIHVQPPKQLPRDIQSILDNAKHGVIFFSMGSNIKSKDLPVSIRDGILRTFSTLKETILWKFEEDDIPGKPANVEIRKWLPQQDILAHPNIKLFISHGGLLSTIEAIYHAVPVLGIPVYGDQRTNMGSMVQKGFGVMVDYRSLSEQTLSRALDEMLHNPKYSESVKYVSRILHDQETKPADRAEFWIKYVVRHKGAPHLRSAALELTWYQHASIDVILFLTLVTIILNVVFYKLIKWILGRKKMSKQKTN